VKVLVAEDDLVSRTLLGRVLSGWGYEVTMTCDGAEAWEVLRGPDAPKLAVLDWMMPELDGPEVCRRVRAMDVPNPPYIILLTARDGKSDIVAGLEAGADDYLGKPFDREELHARLDVGRRFIELNAKLLESQRELEVLARTDTLTGTLNRRAILERFTQEIVAASQNSVCLGLGMVDIDHFKRVNDAYGHAVGDVVLREVVSRAVAAMTPTDAFGRLGGEEFLALIPRPAMSQVVDQLEQIRATICEKPILAVDQMVSVTASIGGFACTNPPCDVDGLIRLADDALYTAKATGRNRVVMAQVPKSFSQGIHETQSTKEKSLSPKSHAQACDMASSC
jgi:two-component system cell cycle response regulator